MVQISAKLFSQLVAKYISHANVLNNSSTHYKKLDFLKHLSKCNNILKWIESNNYQVNAESLCKQLVQNREHLYGILPHTLNNSYRNSLKKVVTIVDAAERALRGEPVEISNLTD